MKKRGLAALIVLLAIWANETRQDDLEYNFEIQNGKNTLVVSKDDQPQGGSTRIAKSGLAQSRKKSKSKRNSDGDDLSKMVKLGVLIDRITDRLEKDDKKKSKRKSASLKKGKKNKKSRKAFLSTGAAVGLAGGAALAGGAMMAGAADNAALEAEIDQMKMKKTMLYIKDEISQQSNDLLSKSNRGFAVLRVKANTLITNFNQKFNIMYDHINNLIEDMENDYENIGVKPKP